jgi:hypothetical protein
LAGRSGASLGRFLVFDGLGVLLWLTAFTSVGYIFSDQLEMIADYAVRTGKGLITVVSSSLAIWITLKYVQRQRFLRSLAVARITAEDLRDKLQAGEDLLIVDVRSVVPGDPDAIPGAVLMSVEEIATRHTEIPRDRDLILVCS